MLEKLPEGIGHALVNQRAGMENVVYNQLHRVRECTRIELRSPAFVFNGRLPARFTADGEGMSPSLAWGPVPQGTGALALLVEDADSPTPHPLVHAIVLGLEGLEGELPEAALASPEHGGMGLPIGPNSFLQHAWLPPDPPRGHGEHRYVFQLYALQGEAPPSPPGRRAFIDWVMEHAVGVGCVIGTYERVAKDPVDSAEAETVGNDSLVASPMAVA